MKRLRKPDRPVDRAVQQLDEQIAQLERQLHQLEAKPATADAPEPGGKMSTFVKSMLKPSATEPTPSYHARKDLFDVADTPLKDLEAEPIAFAPRAVEPDLFSTTATATLTKPAIKDERLVRYLGAGSIRTYKPTKSIQRRDRNRFIVWIGFAIAAVWVLIVVFR